MSLVGKKIVVIGGCGHVGLPLGVKFALAGGQTVLIDIDETTVKLVQAGQFPFREKGGEEQLKTALQKELSVTADPKACVGADVVVFVTGTPVDEHLNPKLSDITKIFDSYREYLDPKTLVVMRSTLFPNTSEYLWKRAQDLDIDIRFAFCPERVAQGFALEEIDSLPQVVSAFDEESFQAAYALFREISPSIIRLSPLEAELMKLMTNSWRYLEFAIANQFYMIAEKSGADFYRIYDAMRHNYPRSDGYKSPGFSAGPCLFKDIMQLASHMDHQFHLGHAGMLVNEGLATFAVDLAEEKLGGSLWGKRVGLLGMTFKPESDDLRESLSFRVKKALEFKGAEVLCHDACLPSSTPLESLLGEAEIIILGVPHEEYRKLAPKIPVVDVWGVFERRSLELFSGRSGKES